MRELQPELVDVEGGLRPAATLVVGVLVAVGVACGDEGGSSSPDATDEITRDEYAQAAADAVRCLHDRGFSASFHEQDDGSFGIQVGTPDESAGASDRIDAAYRECTDRHLNDIQSAYLASIRPSDEEQMEIIRACLTDAGYIDADASMDEMALVWEDHSDDEAFHECRTRPFDLTTSTSSG